MFVEDPFWVEAIEEQSQGRLHATRYVFGAEPLDGKAIDFVQHQILAWFERIQQVRGGKQPRCPSGYISPKRRTRQAACELRQHVISTMAQESDQAGADQTQAEAQPVCAPASANHRTQTRARPGPAEITGADTHYRTAKDWKLSSF